MIAFTIIITAIIAAAYFAVANRKDYPGFSSKARAKAWRGELKKSDISDMEKSIELDTQEKKKTTIKVTV